MALVQLGASQNAPLQGGVSSGMPNIPAPVISPTQVVAPVMNVTPVQNTTVTNDPTYNQPFNYTNEVTNNVASPFEGLGSVLQAVPTIDDMRFAALTGAPAPPSIGQIQKLFDANPALRAQTPFMQPLAAFAMGANTQALPPQITPQQQPLMAQQPQLDKEGGQQPEQSLPTGGGRPQGGPPPMPAPQRPPMPMPMPAPQMGQPMPQGGMPAPALQGGTGGGAPQLSWQQQAQSAVKPNGSAYPTAPDFHNYLPPAPKPPTLLNRVGAALQGMSPRIGYERAKQQEAEMKMRHEMYKADSENYRAIHGDAKDIEKERMSTIKDLAVHEMDNEAKAEAAGKMTQAQGWSQFADAMKMDVSTPDGVVAQAQLLQAASKATGTDLMSHLGKRDADAAKAATQKDYELTKDVLDIKKKIWEISKKDPRELQALDRGAVLQNNEIKMLPVKNAKDAASAQSAMSQAALDANPEVLAARARQAVNAGVHSGQQIDKTNLEMAKTQQDMAAKPIQMGIQASAIGNSVLGNDQLQNQLYSLGANLTSQGQRGYDAVTRYQQAPGAVQGFVPPPPPLVPAIDSRGNIVPNTFMVNGKPMTAAQAQAATPSQTGFQRGALLPPKAGAPLTNPSIRDGYIQQAQAQGGGLDLARELAKMDGWVIPQVKQAAKFLQKAATTPPPPTLAPPVAPQQNAVASYPAMDVPGGQPVDANVDRYPQTLFDDWAQKSDERNKKRRKSEGDNATMGMLAPLYSNPTTGAKGRQVYADLMAGLGR